MKIRYKMQFSYNIIFKIIILFLISFGSLNLIAEEKISGDPVNFRLTDVEGNILTSDDLRGNIIVFNFWFTSCPPCKKEIPELNRLADEFSDKNVVFIAVALDNEDEVEDFTLNNPFSYDIVANGRDFARKMMVNSYPSHIIFDQQGHVHERISGAASFEKLSSSIKLLCYM